MTECPHCKAVLNDWRAYAEHILEKHKDDSVRVAWANKALNPTPQPARKLSLFERLFK